MTKNVFIFLGTFFVGALIALVARAALYKPHAGHTAHAAQAEYAPMVTHSLAPAKTGESSQPKPAGAVVDSSAISGPSSAASAASDKPVNTVCAICGMDVDPKLPTAEYQGKRIGFGCKMCPPKFKANPDKYGPYYLKNEVIN